MLPLSVAGKNQMARLARRPIKLGPNYGKLVAYRFPKGTVCRWPGADRIADQFR